MAQHPGSFFYKTNRRHFSSLCHRPPGVQFHSRLFRSASIYFLLSSPVTHAVIGDVSGKFPATFEKESPSVLILRYSSSSSTPLSRSFLYSVSVCSHVSSQSPRPAPVPRSFSRIETITTIPQATTARRINELISNGTKVTYLPLKRCFRVGNRDLSPRIYSAMSLPISLRRPGPL